MNMEQRADQLASWFNQFPHVCRTLNANHLHWAIGGSASLFLLGGRIPNDLDIFVFDQEHDRLDELLGLNSYFKQSGPNRARHSLLLGEGKIQFTSQYRLPIADGFLPIPLTADLLENGPSIPWRYGRVDLVPPEIIIILKSILMRGEQQGKQDGVDITAFAQQHPVDNVYLSRLASELGVTKQLAANYSGKITGHA